MFVKLNVIGLRWVGEFVDFNFEIWYRLGKLNIDVDSFFRIFVDFKNYMDSCIERVVFESL